MEKRMEIKRRGPKMASGKVRRRELYHLPLASSYDFNTIFFVLFCDLNV